MSYVNYRESITNSNTWTKRFDRSSKIVYIHADYTSTATVGNRQIRLALIDNLGNTVFDAHAGAVQAASLELHYSFAQGVYRETAFVDSQIQVPIPQDIVIPAGYSIKVYDVANVDSNDDFIITYQVEEGIG